MIEFWDTEDSECLIYKTQDEAIEAILDQLDLNQLPETLEMCGYARTVIQEKYLGDGSLLEYILERLDEEYGYADGYTEPTEAMIDAEKAFIGVILSEYKPWTCEIVERKTINVQEWVETHRSDWRK